MIDILTNALKRNGTVNLSVRVHPGAKRTRYVDFLSDGSLKIDLTAPASGGEANAALIKFFAKLFGVPQWKVQILAGFKGRKKFVRILANSFN